LVDGGELTAQTLVEVFDNFWVALHRALRILAAEASLHIKLEHV
jgi:hypothetical protein